MCCLWMMLKNPAWPVCCCPCCCPSVRDRHRPSPRRGRSSETRSSTSRPSVTKGLRTAFAEFDLRAAGIHLLRSTLTTTSSFTRSVRSFVRSFFCSFVRSCCAAVLHRLHNQPPKLTIEGTPFAQGFNLSPTSSCAPVRSVRQSVLNVETVSAGDRRVLVLRMCTSQCV